MGLFTGVNVYLKNIIRNTDNLYDRMVEINEMVVEPLMESGLSRAEAVAETVLGLLRIGEGKYVTEELLKDADKSYLVDNYDLPLDEISTLARARDQGFDLDNPMYRGRTDDRGSPESLRARRVYTVDDPSTALTYSQKFENLDYDSKFDMLKNSPEAEEVANTILGFHMRGEPEKIPKEMLEQVNINKDKLVKSGMIDKYVMRPSINESGDIVEPIVIDAKGKTWANIPVDARASVGESRSTIGDLLGYNKFLQETSTDKIGRDLENILAEYQNDLPLPKTVVYENVIDEGPIYQALIRRYMAGLKPATVRMDLDKSVIRKAYDPEDKLENRPRFDSRLRHLKNLLASSAPVAVSLGALSDLKEEPQ